MHEGSPHSCAMPYHSKDTVQKVFLFFIIYSFLGEHVEDQRIYEAVDVVSR